MDPCHTCHAEFGWQAAALKGPGSSTRFDLHEKNAVGLYPPSGRMRMHCCGAFQTWRTVWKGHEVWWTSYSNLDDNKCGVPLSKKRCWNIEYTEHHVIFENEYIISICDRSASHMVPYVISVVADCAQNESTENPKNSIPTWHTRDLLSTSGWRHVCPCSHWLAGGAAQRVGPNRCTHPGLICWDKTLLAVPVFPSQGGNGTCYWLC